ncbi:hypothetical protein DFA_02383 [Cavenderia fasciculata]|uniref:Uncharacterized protein n=1 Tax=Cavenderia fasciculata TaxID=261658 RepID=F4PZA7_CACFS|nr:uncharacterized protein DFA_02383 [Cavenderia fasciculata]EGG19136.1 hypothetical protein DFA_02383 [Cavenderia fasciculata]|eukprot:XP_004366769.1 hypothetical protein DFA_02383 [Cavenderia fasciculata]
MSMYDLSNLLLSQIITEIEDNVDIICLLLTCKKLYNNSSLKRSIQFKGVGEVINTEKGEVSQQFIATFSLFKLLSFKDILKNSISDQQAIFPELDQKEYKLGFYLNKDDKSSRNITTALVHYLDVPTAIESAYKIPSIETLFIDDEQSQVINLSSIQKFLPRLQRLSVSAGGLELGHCPSLKYLKLDTDTAFALADLALEKFESLTELSISCYYVSSMGLFPSSLTSLTLGQIVIPPRDTFIALTSLVYLEIKLMLDMFEGAVMQSEINLSPLHKLETFKIKGDCFNQSIEITLPPSIKVLDLLVSCEQIPSKCKLLLLEKLNVSQSLLIEGGFSMASSPLLKDLVITNCHVIMPANLIPPSVQKLVIDKSSEEDILGQVVFPPSLTHLTIKGDYCESIQHLPESLVKLNQVMTESVYSSLPIDHQLEKLNLLDIIGDFKIDISSPSIKYLSIPLNPITNTTSDIFSSYSISSMITTLETITNQPKQQWLPPNTTHLSCYLKNHAYEPLTFRLDEIVNHTNVRYLSLIFDNHTTLQFSIQRLDSDNNNVLVLERQSLTGGIITQQQYDSIKFYFMGRSSISFHFNWDFTSSSSSTPKVEQ